MSLIVFNGSPRGRKSNSSTIISWFLSSQEQQNTPVCFLNQAGQHKDFSEKLKEHDTAVFVFPLYVDGMPGQVKGFIEELAARKGAFKGKAVLWIIHSGFSEAVHSRTLEKYLNRITGRMGAENVRVIVIPGSEGFRLMPSSMTSGKRRAVRVLADDFRAGKALDRDIEASLIPREKMSGFGSAVFRGLSGTGLFNMYWNRQMKKYGVFSIRFQAPYGESYR